MTLLRLALVAALVVPAASSQIVFELQTPGPFPVLPGVDAEGVGALPSTATAPGPVVSATPNCGFPAAGGFQYAYIQAGGAALTIPPGGPIPLAAAAGVVHGIQIPVPSGAASVSFTWEFFDAEASATWNDAFEVSAIDGGGLRIGAPLVYADASMGVVNPGTCFDVLGTGGTEVGAPLFVTGAPQVFCGGIPSGAVALLVLCANGGDDSFPSAGAVDDFFFDVCPLLRLDQPFGPGSLRVEILNSTANAAYLLPVKIGPPGAFPFGWCLGIDLTLAELMAEISFGPPFLGTLDSSGSMSFVIPSGVPAGLPIQAGAGIFDGGGLTSQLTPQSITTL